ncbi:hypothetical protein E3Q17_03064 [Wallemia mellicola]|uniref:Uncharacterized protein n=1 Tax=Wallemia mellicola TaxID=1708541 RepID=A0A4T0NMA1_9BASI|nr:hypothetical protein E3Q17_03064 [Wallemia mellicola]
MLFLIAKYTASFVTVSTMNVSRKDIYDEHEDEEVEEVDDGARAMLEKMLSSGWSNAVETQIEEKEDDKMDEDKPEETPALCEFDSNSYLLFFNLHIAFKLLSNAPVTKINVEDAAEASSAEYDKSVREHNEKQRQLRESSPSNDLINSRKSQFESVAVDFNWIKEQSTIHWKPLSSPTKKTATGPLSAEVLALAKTDVKDDEEEKDKQGLVSKPYVPRISLEAPKQHNTIHKKAKKLRTPPAFFAARPDECKYAASAAYFYSKPSSRPFNRPDGCQRKYIRSDKRGITAQLEYARIAEEDRLAKKAEAAEQKLKLKNKRKFEGRGTGKGDTLGVSRVSTAGGNAAATGANAT